MALNCSQAPLLRSIAQSQNIPHQADHRPPTDGPDQTPKPTPTDSVSIWILPLNLSPNVCSPCYRISRRPNTRAQGSIQHTTHKLTMMQYSLPHVKRTPLARPTNQPNHSPTIPTPTPTAPEPILFIQDNYQKVNLSAACENRTHVASELRIC